MLILEKIRITSRKAWSDEYLTIGLQVKDWIKLKIALRKC